MFFSQETQIFIALFIMSSHWTKMYLPWILYTLTLCPFHIYREILFPLLCHLRITHFKRSPHQKFSKYFLHIGPLSYRYHLLLLGSFPTSSRAVLLVYYMRSGWTGRARIYWSNKIASLCIMYNTYIHTYIHTYIQGPPKNVYTL